ncbi:CoA transferase subunit A [Oceanobacillus piezotolerans]|uniref:CoA transferase subunit A n=1 Tax=Oceanobacillus piezotolerans TaxID=2448030 RepID=A0A498D1V9_9BACI|nr:CoA-transferase [Oceanobacillus piezotolerans]RLL41111.1 CoA transferase subunit A [Oceanobacillus piezotolerans]
MLAIGENVLHRAPMAFIRELARRKKSKLSLVKTAGAHDIDLLYAVGAVKTVTAGFVSYETVYGLPKHYRKAVESGEVKTNEHACYTVISALRGAQANVPFMPVQGMQYGDLIKYNDYFVVVEDPFTKEPVTLVQSIFPDVAIIHVQECDEQGNAIIYGPKFEDVLMSRAAKRIIITTEQIVPRYKTKQNNERIDIPGFLVEAVVHVPKGALPTSCYKKYELDDKALRTFIGLKEKAEINQFISSYDLQDYSGQGRKRSW